MDDLEGGANPRWDDDWRHTYATGLAEFIDVNTRTNPTADPEAVAIGAGFDKIAIGLLLTKWPNWAGFDKMAIGA